MSKKCNDTNIPEVDETSLECCEIQSTNCVMTSEAVPCLKTGKGVTLTKLFKNLCIVIKDIYSKLTDMENAVDNIDNCNGLSVDIVSSENTLTAAVSGGEAPYTYLWKVTQGAEEGHVMGATFDEPVLSTSVIPNSGVLLETGSDKLYSTLFKLTVTDSNGCVKEEYFMHTEKQSTGV